MRTNEIKHMRLEEKFGLIEDLWVSIAEDLEPNAFVPDRHMENHGGTNKNYTLEEIKTIIAPEEV